VFFKQDLCIKKDLESSKPNLIWERYFLHSRTFREGQLISRSRIFVRQNYFLELDLATGCGSALLKAILCKGLSVKDIRSQKWFVQGGHFSDKGGRVLQLQTSALFGAKTSKILKFIVW